MGLVQRAAKLLGAFNGIFIGTFMGVAGYVWLSTGQVTLFGMVDATVEVGGYAVGAATSTTVTSKVTSYPLGPIWAGLLSGAVGAGLAFYTPFLVSAPVVSTIVKQLITGLIAGGVIGVLTRLLPGL